MNNEKLIEYLRSSLDPLESSLEFESGNPDSKMMTYLYFAPVEERLSIHVAERSLHYGSWHSLTLSQTQKNQNDILAFRPYFDAALAKQKITSITAYNFPKTLENASENSKTNFIKEISVVEKLRGILNALLTLRNWASFPKDNKGAKNRKRLAVSFMSVVLNHLHVLKDDPEIDQFLHWCGKKTRKISAWGFKDKELRTPPKSALPIYKDEAAGYVRHFLQLTCAPENVLRQHSAEMVVFLSLCLACSRRHSNGFSPSDLLEINHSSIRDIEVIPKVAASSPVRDIRAKSRSSKNADAPDLLQLRISEEFLTDDLLWPSATPLTDPQKSQGSKTLCKIIRIGGRDVLISQKLAVAIGLMGKFSISDKDVANRLKDAYRAVPLSQSTGGISPRCFLFSPHYWEGVDARKSWEVAKK